MSWMRYPFTQTSPAHRCGHSAATTHAARVPHNATDLGPDTGRMLSAYVVETGEPLALIVRGPAGTAVVAAV